MYDQLVEAQRKSLCDRDVRKYFQRSMGYVLFRFNEASRSKTFWMMVAGHDCGKSGFLQAATLAGGDYVCPVNKAQLSRNGGELTQASAIAGGHRLVLLDDSAERGKLDITNITSTFTNVNQVVVRKAFGHQTRTIASTPCLWMALNWKAMDQDIGKDERVKAALVTEEAFDGTRRFMGRFVPRDDDVDEDEGIFLQDPAFKQWGDAADKRRNDRKGAAARLCYQKIKDAPDFDPVRAYPSILREGRDEHWEHYVQKGKKAPALQLVDSEAVARARAALRSWWFQQYEPAEKKYVVIQDALKAFRNAHCDAAATLEMKNDTRTAKFKAALQEALRFVPEGDRGQYDDGKTFELDQKQHGRDSDNKPTGASFKGWTIRVEEAE